MTVDIIGLQNFGSDTRSLGSGGIQGNRPAGQAKHSSDAALKEGDFRSNLKQAEGQQEAATSEAKPTAGSGAAHGDPLSRKGEGEDRPQNNGKTLETLEGRHSQGLTAVGEEDDQETPVVAAVSIGEDAFASVIDDRVGGGGDSGGVAVMPPTHFPAGADEADSDLPTGKAPDISPDAGPKDNPAEASSASAKPEPPVSATSASGSVAAAGFEDAVTSRPLTPAGQENEMPAGTHSTASGRPDGKVPVEIDSAGTVPDHSEEIGRETSTSETHKVISKIENTSRTAAKVSDNGAEKVLAETSSRMEPQVPESTKKERPITPVSEPASFGDSLNRKGESTESKGLLGANRADRVAAGNDHRSQSEQNSVVPNDARVNQDGSTASAAKSGADVDQGLKVNDFLLSTQRPMGGDGNAPVSTENTDARLTASKADVLNQIVDRAAFRLHNGQAEVRIDLKPDFLGPVRLQIVTESHQVNLRILAESHAVKDIIDGNLGQLKNDLQSQGLKVDEIEVSVAKDFNAYDRRSDATGHGHHRRRGFAFNERQLPDSEGLDSHPIVTPLNHRTGGINCFA